MRAYPPEQRELVVGREAEALHAPGWWPRDDAKHVTVQTILGKEFSPCVKFVSLYPTISYLNPISSKANRPQGDPTHAYLIAVDISDLPRAHERAANELNNALCCWQRVSAVMLFDYRPWIGVDKKEWMISLHLNPYGKIPLPTELVSYADPINRSIAFDLRARP